MVADITFPVVDIQSPDEERHRRQLAAVINSVRDGKLNANLSFTLDVTPATTTTVIDPRIAATSRIILVPMNAAAAGDYAAGTVQIQTVEPGQFVLSHTLFALARDFRASVLS